MSKINLTVQIAFIITLSVLSDQIQWVSAVPSPQWGVPAAADAANAIDAERFHAHSVSAAAEIVRPLQDDHVPLEEEAEEEIAPPSLSSSFPLASSEQGLMASTTSRRRKTARRKGNILKRRNNGEHSHSQHYHSRRGGIKRQLPQIHYQRPQTATPLPNWGFWKWGQDNFYSFLNTLFN